MATVTASATEKAIGSVTLTGMLTKTDSSFPSWTPSGTGSGIRLQTGTVTRYSIVIAMAWVSRRS